MTTSTPPYQLKFDLDLPEEESNSALSAEDIQLRKDIARAFLENPDTWPKDDKGKPQKPYWFDRYELLCYGKWPFRVAVLIAWLETPKKYRWPRTQDELANLLGLSSDRQFTVWIARNPQIKAMVHQSWKEKALDRLSDSMDAMFEVAAQPDYKGKGDRELHFKVAEVLTDKVILDRTGNIDLSKLTFEEKLRLAGLDSPEALIALKKELTQYEDIETHAEDEGNEPGDA